MLAGKIPLFIGKSRLTEKEADKVQLAKFGVENPEWFYSLLKKRGFLKKRIASEDYLKIVRHFMLLVHNFFGDECVLSHFELCKDGKTCFNDLYAFFTHDWRPPPGNAQNVLDLNILDEISFDNFFKNASSITLGVCVEKEMSAWIEWQRKYSKFIFIFARQLSTSKIFQDDPRFFINYLYKKFVFADSDADLMLKRFKLVLGDEKVCAHSF